jgi:hypothetical protein
MKLADMTDYEMGYKDFVEGLDPIPDPQDTEEDRQYMRGYHDARMDAFWDDACMMATQDEEN